MNTLKNIKVIGRSITVTLFCTLFVIPAYSGEVTYPDDSYSPGDPLTALDLNTKFNEIKSAVNDNDTNTGSAGVGFASSTADFQLTTTTSTIQSVALTAPGPGQVIVSFSAYYRMFHATGSSDLIQVGIATTPGADVSGLSSRRLLFLDSRFTDGEFFGSVASHAVFTVPSAGTFTYFVLGVSNKATATAGFTVSHPATQAVFVPNSY